MEEEEEEYQYFSISEQYYKMMAAQWPEEPDFISKLPDSLLCQILLYLPIKDIVRTRVLSKKWKSVWLFIPRLELYAAEFPDHTTFASFMDRFIDFSREHKLCLDKFKLSIPKDKYAPPCVTPWLHSLVTRRLNHLDVECLSANRKFLEVIPSSLYVCDTLVDLRLHRVRLGEFESVPFPCLKTMRLEENVYANDAALESLISSCRVLEDLIIFRMEPDNVKVLRVRSQTLTSLKIDLSFGEGDDIDDEDFEKKGTGVLIDAPRLEYLKFQDDISDSKILINSGSLAKVNLTYVFNEYDRADVVELPKRIIVRNFFTSISGVKDMKMSSHTVEFLYYNMDFDPMPQFWNLSSLKVKLGLSYLDFLPTFLESCRNLKSLVLVLEVHPEDETVEIRLPSLDSVPLCLLLSLEVVEIKDFNRGPGKMEVTKYFLENALILEKLVLHSRFYTVENGYYMLRDLLALPRRSSTCQIIIR